MDPDGTLHNLRPIARLDVSGPDQEPRRAADTDFGGMWFAPKLEDEAAPEPPQPQPEASQAGPNGNEAGPSATRTEAALPEMAAAEPAAAPSAAGEADGAEGTSGEGLVLDFDLTGLLNGVTIATEPEGPQEPHEAAAPQDQSAETAAAPIVRKAGPPGAAEVRAEVADRMAALSLIPGPEPVLDKDAATPPKPVERPAALSAADLDAIRWRLDGGTLREVVDNKDALRELGEKLDGPLAEEVENVAKAGLLSVRAEVYRLLGELGMAAAASRLALAHAESAQDTQSMVIAQAELAHILRLRGDFKEADRLFAKASGAAVPEMLRSVVHENAGRCCFDQGRHMEALDHFAKAVRLGRPDDQELAERIGVCLEAVYIHVLRDGWGPYPRERQAILGPEASKRAKGDAFNEVTAERQIVRPR
jgi:tetratricopeptide (TPR) repeat protein